MPFDFVPQQAADRARKAKASYRTGLCAEQAAAQHYQAKGGHIKAQRFRAGCGEIDIVVEDRGVLVFVEVKGGASFDAALMRVTPDKAARLFEAAQHFLSQNGLTQSQEMRFDVAAVDRLGRVQITENALWFD